jgi:methionine-rich copper-binding protein CopC
MNSIDTKVAVLEQIAIAHDKRISDMEDFHRDVVDRFDQKIQLDASNQVTMERTIAKVVVTLENLNTSMLAVAAKSEDASKVAHRLDLVANVLLKVGTATAALVGAAWAVFTYLR